MSEKVTLDRAACCWRGLDMAKVDKALQPAFKPREGYTRCPVCGVLFRKSAGNTKRYCSLPCGAKGGWSRRREDRRMQDAD